MIFRETPLRGAYLVEMQKVEDERGYYARTWCEREFEEAGITSSPAGPDQHDVEPTQGHPSRDALAG